jgi:hypothetical protein
MNTTIRAVAGAAAAITCLTIATACGNAPAPTQQIGVEPDQPQPASAPACVGSAEYSERSCRSAATQGADDRRWDGTLRANIPD